MMTMPSMLKTSPELWHKFHEILDIVLTTGVYHAPDFGRGHREFLFAYISRKNNCYFCSTMHFELARALGVHSLPQEITDLADSLYESILMPHLGEFTPLVEQILYTISVAKFINTQVVAHDVHISPTTLLKSPVFLASGYGTAFGHLKNQESYK
jgi:AhpD family alkylhydroperoxidase